MMERSCVVPSGGGGVCGTAVFASAAPPGMRRNGEHQCLRLETLVGKSSLGLKFSEGKCMVFDKIGENYRWACSTINKWRETSRREEAACSKGDAATKWCREVLAFVVAPMGCACLRVVWYETLTDIKYVRGDYSSCTTPKCTDASLPISVGHCVLKPGSGAEVGEGQKSCRPHHTVVVIFWIF